MAPIIVLRRIYCFLQRVHTSNTRSNLFLDQQIKLCRQPAHRLCVAVRLGLALPHSVLGATWMHSGSMPRRPPDATISRMISCPSKARADAGRVLKCDHLWQFHAVASSRRRAVLDRTHRGMRDRSQRFAAILERGHRQAVDRELRRESHDTGLAGLRACSGANRHVRYDGTLWAEMSALFPADLCPRSHQGACSTAPRGGAPPSRSLSVLKGDIKSALAGGEKSLLPLIAATSTGMTPPSSRRQ